MLLVTAKEMQTMDRKTIEEFGIPGLVLMELAGHGATQTLINPKFNLTGPSIARSGVGILAGRGNNGGDGFVIARWLKKNQIPVCVYLFSDRLKVQGDAKTNLNFLTPLDIPVVEVKNIEEFQKVRVRIAHHCVLVDAILGTGLNADVKNFYYEVIKSINQMQKKILAVDIPSGLNADTGQPCGICINATATATFAYPKIGHAIYPGLQYTGQLHVIDIGIPSHVVAAVDPKTRLITKEMICKTVPRRSATAHKGDAGHILVIAGAVGKTGAAVMTAKAAMKTGSGLVTLSVPKTIQPVVGSMVLEAMTNPLPDDDTGILHQRAIDDVKELLPGKACLAVGPGIGTEESVRKFVLDLLNVSNCPIVIDADGLNCIALQMELVRKIHPPKILTPHPGEMARLMSISTEDVQKNRIEWAKKCAKTYNAYVVLKGARTVIAQPDQSVFINPTGNSGMASGGMGDVLCGMIASLIGQNIPVCDAIKTAVFIHGSAADKLKKVIGPIGYVASEVIDEIPNQIRELSDSRSN